MLHIVLHLAWVPVVPCLHVQHLNGRALPYSGEERHVCGNLGGGLCFVFCTGAHSPTGSGWPNW